MKNAVVGRIVDVLPLLVLFAVGLVGVFVAMNLLVAAIPADTTPAPSEPVALNSMSAGPTLTYAPVMATPTPTPVMTVALPNTAPAIWKGVAQAKDPAGIWSALMYYPRFAPGSTPLADTMNADITSEVADRLAQWEVGPAAVKSATGKVNQFAGNFTVEMTSPTIASFTMTWYDNVADTDPTTYVETINYDLGTGARMSLDDVFTDPSAALAILSNQSATLLQTYLGKDYDQATVAFGTSASPANFTAWSLTPAGLKITFPEYQVAPYADGLPQVTVPWSALSEVLPTKGPVAQLAGR